MYSPDPDSPEVQEGRAVMRSIRLLRARAHLDPMDPDSLNEEEQEQLEKLEDWSP